MWAPFAREPVGNLEEGRLGFFKVSRTARIQKKLAILAAGMKQGGDLLVEVKRGTVRHS